MVTLLQPLGCTAGFFRKHKLKKIEIMQGKPIKCRNKFNLIRVDIYQALKSHGHNVKKVVLIGKKAKIKELLNFREQSDCKL